MTELAQDIPQTNTTPPVTNPQTPTAPFIPNPPESMTTQSQTTFKAKSSSGKKFFCVFVVIFLLIFLSLGGVTALAFFTDTNIPIISDIVNKFKDTKEDEDNEENNENTTSANSVQEKLASTLFSVILPNMTGSGIESSLLQSNISQDYVENVLSDYEEIKSMRFDISFDADYEQPLEGISDIGLNLVGGMNMKDELSSKLETSINFDMNYQGMDVLVDADIKSVGEDSFIKINSLTADDPTISSLLSNYYNQWMKISSQDLESTTDMIATDDETTTEFSEDDIDKMIEFITDDTIFKNSESLSDENIEGNACSCTKFSWNKEELIDVIQRYNEIYENDATEAEISDSLVGIDILTLTACLGKSSNMIHKIVINLSGTEEESPINMEATLLLWDYNEDIAVSIPEDYIEFETVMQDLLGPLPSDNTNPLVIE